jgi:two-component sensor histidine kinase
MSENFQYPLERMRQQAQTMQSETASLADETHARIQTIQQLHASMPASMQGAFGDFISLMQQHLSNGLTLREHISQSLTEAASVMQDADTTIAQGFK